MPVWPMMWLNPGGFAYLSCPSCERHLGWWKNDGLTIVVHPLEVWTHCDQTADHCPPFELHLGEEYPTQ